MTGTNAELIAWGRMLGGREQELADALEAAEAALSTEKRDAALTEKHWHRDKADLDFIAAERDAALAVIAAVGREHSSTSLTQWPSGVLETCDGCRETVPCPTSVLAAK